MTLKRRIEKLEEKFGKGDLILPVLYDPREKEKPVPGRYPHYMPKKDPSR